MASFCALLVAMVLGLVLGTGAQGHYNTAEIEAANFAIGRHNRLNDYPYAYKVISIMSDTPQMYPPARVKFTMTVSVGQTVCRNRPGISLASCGFQDPPHLTTMTCHFVVLSVPNSDVPSYLLKDHCS